MVRTLALQRAALETSRRTLYAKKKTSTFLLEGRPSTDDILNRFITEFVLIVNFFLPLIQIHKQGTKSAYTKPNSIGKKVLKFFVPPVPCKASMVATKDSSPPAASVVSEVCLTKPDKRVLKLAVSAFCLLLIRLGDESFIGGRDAMNMRIA